MTELERLDWLEIVPLMDRQYDIYHAGDEAQSGAQEATEEPPPLPPGYRATYNERGEYTYTFESDFFKDKPEYWDEAANRND